MCRAGALPSIELLAARDIDEEQQGMHAAARSVKKLVVIDQPSGDSSIRLPVVGWLVAAAPIVAFAVRKHRPIKFSSYFFLVFGAYESSYYLKPGEEAPTVPNLLASRLKLEQSLTTLFWILRVSSWCWLVSLLVLQQQAGRQQEVRSAEDLKVTALHYMPTYDSLRE